MMHFYVCIVNFLLYSNKNHTIIHTIDSLQGLSTETTKILIPSHSKIFLLQLTSILLKHHSNRGPTRLKIA